MDVDALIEELAGEGRVDAVGRFTLDREKAREKTRKFQLAEPLNYLLELVQAATGQGATRVDVTVDTDDMWLTFDGPGFDGDDLNGLYDALLSPQPELEVRRCLAVGLNSALARDPRFVELRTQGWRMTLRPGQPDALDPLDPPLPGGRIHVKDRFSPAQIVEFFQNLFGEPPEVAVLREGCRHAELSVTVNGQLVSHGLQAPALNAWVSVPWPPEAEDGRRPPRGWAGVRGDEDPGRLVLCTFGVVIETRLRMLPGVEVRVDAPGLKKDASRFKFVQDDHHAALMAAVDAAAWDALAQVGEAAAAAGWPAEHRGTALMQRTLTMYQGHAANLPRYRGERLAAVLLALPLPELGGLTLGALLRQQERWGRLAWAPPDVAAPLSTGEPVLALTPEAVGPLASRFPKGTVVDAAEDLEADAALKARLERWRGRPTEPVLPADPSLAVRVPVHHAGLVGEVGWRPGSAAEPRLALVAQEALLAEGSDALLPELEGIEVILGDLIARPDARWVEPHDGLVPALWAALEALADALLDAPRPPLPLLGAWLTHRESPALWQALARWAGLAEVAWERAPATTPLARPTRWAALPLWRWTDGQAHGLAHLAQGAVVSTVAVSVPPAPGAEPVCLYVDPEVHRQVRALRPDLALVDGRAALHDGRGRAEFLARPATGPRLDQPARVRVTVETPEVRGVVALADGADHGPDGPPAEVALYLEGRRLDTLPVSLGLGGLIAAVAPTDLTATPDYRRAADRPRLAARLARVLAEAVPRLLDALGPQPSDDGRLARGLIALAWPCVEARRAHDRLRATLGPDRGDAEYAELRRRLGAAGFRQGARTLAAALARPDEPLTAAALPEGQDPVEAVTLRVLLEDVLATDRPRPILARLAARWPALAAQPVAWRPDGAPVPLRAVLHALAAGEPVVPVPPGQAPEPDRFDLRMARDADFGWAEILVGRAALMPLDTWRRTVRLRRVLAGRPEADPHTLPSERVCSQAALPAGAVGLAHPHPGPQRSADSPVSLIRGGRRALTLYPVLSARVQVHLVDDALPLEEDKGFLALPKAAGEALAGQAEAAVDAAFEALLTAWPLDAAKAASARNHVLDRLALGGPDRLREPLRALPLLPRYGAEPVSLAALDAHWAAGRGVAALGPHEVPPAGWDAVADPHEWVLVLPHASLQRLERLLQDALPTVAERLEVVQGQQAFAARPEVAAALPPDDPSVLRVRFERRHIEGEVGWAPPAEPWALRGHTVHVRLHHQGRLLCTLELPSPVRGLRAAVAATHLTPTATLDGVVPDEALADVHRAVLAGARRLLYRTPKAQRDGLGPLVADLIRLSCPDPGFAAVWAALHADRPAARAQVGYALRLAAAWDGVDPARILQDPLAEPPTLTPDLGTPWGELALILSGDPVRKQDGPLATRVLDALPGNAAQLPLAQGPAGPLSGESLRAAGEAAPAVLVVPPETEDPGDGALRVTGVDPAVVAALVGERLTDEAGWATRQRRAAVLAAQPPLPTPPAGALGRVALQGDKLHGVAWLAPGEPPRVLVGRARRTLGAVPLAGDLPVQAVLDGEDTPVAWDAEDRCRPAEPEAAAALAAQGVPALVQAACAAWPRLDAAAQAALRAPILGALADAAAHPGLAAEHLPPILRSALTTPLFQGLTDEPLSLADLRPEGQRPVKVVSPDAPRVEGLPGPIVRATPAEQQALRRLALRVVPQDGRVQARLAALVARQAQPLPDPPADAWAKQRLRGRALRGEVWIPRADAPRVLLGADGGLVATAAASLVHPLPFAAAVTGPGVIADPINPQAGLTEHAVAELVEAVEKLYRHLARAWADGQVDDRDQAPLQARLRAARDALRAEAGGLATVLAALPLLDLSPTDQSPADQSPADQSPAAPVPVPAVVGVPSVVEPVAEQPARPEPPPQPRPQAPGEALLGALHAALGRMRREAPRAFDGVDLHRLGVVTGSRKGPPLHLDRGGVTLDLAHPWVAAAAADPRPERVALLACLIHGAWVEGRPGEARLEAKAVTAAAHWLRGALPAEVP